MRREIALCAGFLRRLDIIGAVKYVRWAMAERRCEAQLGIGSSAYISQAERGTDATECNASEAASYLGLETAFRRIDPQVR